MNPLHGSAGLRNAEAFARWTLRLLEARWSTTRALRSRPLDACLADSDRTGLAAAADESGILDEVEWVSDFWLRTVPLTRTSCMPRALARFRLLRRAGVPVEFVLGIRPDASDLVGHAWLELRGVPIMEREALNYQQTFRYGAQQ